MQQDSLKLKQIPAMTENGKILVLIKEAWKLVCCYGNHTQLIWLTKGAVTRGNFFLQIATQIYLIFQAPVEL